MTPRPLLPRPARRRHAAIRGRTIFGYPRDVLDNRFVYLTVSPSARGLSVGVNLCPAPPAPWLDVAAMGTELVTTLDAVSSGRLLDRPAYRAMPEELRQLRQVALSGDGEVLRCPVLVEAIETALHVRAASGLPFFKIVLITSAKARPSARAREGLALLTGYDELWVQLDAGTQGYFERVHGPECSLRSVLENIAEMGKAREVVIQSLFVALDGKPPSAAEVAAYVQRLLEMRREGVEISRVQISSVSDEAIPGRTGHLPLSMLSAIAAQAHDATGLLVEVF